MDELALNETGTSLEALAAQVVQMQAERAQERMDYNEALDTVWMLVAAFLFVFVHTGFSMREAGCIRNREPQTTLAKNLLAIALVFLCWWGWGYAFAFGTMQSRNKFIGSAHFFMSGFEGSNFRVWFFQGAFCTAVASIAGGAMAERTDLRGYCVHAVTMASLIYPVVTFWSWSGEGLLSRSSVSSTFFASVLDPTFKDAAGSGVVHLTGGISALVGAAAVGPRKGRFSQQVPQDVYSSGTPFCVSGTLFLWFGWFGLNAGSVPGMHTVASANRAGLAACNSTLAPCVSAVLVALLQARRNGVWALDVSSLCNGLLAGLVSVAAGCETVEPQEAALVGFIGGLVYLGASKLVRALKIDDAVDAFAVHGACGLWGILAVGCFGDPSRGRGGNGVLYGGNQLWTQILAAILISVWVSLLSSLVFVPLRLFGLLRAEVVDTQECGYWVEKTETLPRSVTDDLDNVISLEI